MDILVLLVAAGFSWWFAKMQTWAYCLPKQWCKQNKHAKQTSALCYPNLYILQLFGDWCGIWPLFHLAKPSKHFG